MRRPRALAALGLVLATAPVATAQARVLHGQPVPRRTYPWTASIQVDRGDGRTHICGGSLITPDRILTAAHCVTAEYRSDDPTVIVDVTATSLRVVVGQPVLGAPRLVYRRVVGVRVYPRFRRVRAGRRVWSYGDVAVLRLARRVATSPVLIARPRADPATSWATATVLGWGATETVTHPRSLRAAPVRIAPPGILPADARRLLVPKTQVVVVTEPGRGTGACRGDSGGPLIVDRGGRPVLVGIVNFGVVDCPGPTPVSIFARVAAYVPWLARHELSAPFNLALPTIVGAPRIGHRVRCALGSWTAGAKPFRVAWYVQSEVGAVLVKYGRWLDIGRTIEGEPSYQLPLWCEVAYRSAATRIVGRATSATALVRR